MKIHIIMHESFEAPAAIEIWARSKNNLVSYTRLYENEQLPITTDNFDYLIIMGGPQSPSTTIEECPYFDAHKEIAFIKMAIDHNKAVLGICLGAQLIGEALNATFDHSPNREIGVFDITLTEAAKEDPFFASLPNKFPVGHRHGDMPGLTNDTSILAFSDGCPRQIVKYTPKVYGFQCHFEFTTTAIEGMIINCARELEAYKDGPYIQNAETLKNNDYSKMNNFLFQFLDYIQDIQMKS